MNFPVWNGRWVAALSGMVLSALTQAQTLGGDFAGSYSVNDLGAVPGLPVRYGGLTFIDNNTLLIGGDANTADGSLYTVTVQRDANNHVVGFGPGGAVRYGTAIGEYNDGGVAFGPGGVLFTSRWPVNELGQTKPGSTDEDKIIDMSTLGVADSHAAIGFVPLGFSGAGSMKLVSYIGGEWYSAGLQADGSGTYDIVNLAQVDLDLSTPDMDALPGGPEGFVYIHGASPGFGKDSMLISEYAANTVGVYDIDANGNPLLGTRRDFLSGLNGAEGAVIDPLTGDFMFSTFGSENRVVVVTGFVPEPATWVLLALGLLGGMAVVRRRGRA